MEWIKLYVFVGVIWVSLGLWIGYIKLKIYHGHPAVVLLVIMTFWPYLLYRMIDNLCRGQKSGPIWP